MKSLFGFLCLVLLQACCPGGADKEVSLDVSFSGSLELPLFDRIVAENANRNIVLKTLSGGSGTYSDFKLPVNTNADSTRYFFFRPGQIDTVVIRYTRIFNHSNCGLLIDFKNESVSKNTLSASAFVSLGLSGGLPGNFRNSINFSN